MLALLGSPALGVGDEGGIALENLAQIGDIVGGVGFDERGGLDDCKQGRIDAGGVETVPGDAVESPVGQIAAP